MAENPGSGPAAFSVSDVDEDAGLASVAALMRAIFDAPVAAFALSEPERPGTRLRARVEDGDRPEVRFCRHAVLDRRALAVEDAAADPAFASHPAVTGPPHVRGFLGVPVTSAEGYAIGAIGVMDPRPRRFAPDAAALLRRFGELVAALTELRRLANRDLLTGTLTRRAFEDSARREIARCRRHGTPASLALFDLDHFKAINDTFGHAAGDDVLRTVALTCTEALRESDALGRVGGEEFAILLVGAGPAEARATLERLRRAIEAARILARPDLVFTASFGAVAFAPRFVGLADWMAAADACLYAAKRAGRNRCVIEGDAAAPGRTPPPSRPR